MFNFFKGIFMERHITRINQIAKRNGISLPDAEDWHCIMNPDRLFIDDIKRIPTIECVNLRIMYVGSLLRDKLDGALDEQTINKFLDLVCELTNAQVQLCNVEDSQPHRQLTRLWGARINIDSLLTPSLPKSSNALAKPMNSDDAERLIEQIKDKIRDFSGEVKIPHETQSKIWSRITELRNLEVRRCNLEDNNPLKNLRCLLGIEDTPHAKRDKIPVPPRLRKIVRSVTKNGKERFLPR